MTWIAGPNGGRVAKESEEVHVGSSYQWLPTNGNRVEVLQRRVKRS